MDITTIRQDTPGTADALFFNSAGSALTPRPVQQKMIDYLLQEEVAGGYETERLRAADVNLLYDELAILLNCKPHNTAFAYSATDAYNKALSAIPFQKDDAILTTTNDYVSNQIAFLSLQKRYGLKVLRAHNLANGDIDLEHFEEMIRLHHPALIAITHIPTNSGIVLQAEAIGKLSRKYDTWYLLDACQSAGQMNLDVKKIDCDFLSATGRKFLRGPRTSGFLYVSDEALQQGLEPLFPDMKGAGWTGFDTYTTRDTAKRFESQEISATHIGLGAAISYLNRIGVDSIAARNQDLMEQLRSRLRGISGMSLLDRGSVQSNILTFNLEGRDTQSVANLLRQEHVLFSLSLKPYALIDFTEKNTESAIRLSPHYFNTSEEINRLADIIAAV
jgi:cysteine desulfurase/selenocysteine lyase